MNLLDAVNEIQRAGGILSLEGESSVQVSFSPGTKSLMDVLRECKPELVELLRRVGGRVANFPRCTRCRSYALYRQGNQGDFECQSCGLMGIPEPDARAYEDSVGVVQ